MKRILPTAARGKETIVIKVLETDLIEKYRKPKINNIGIPIGQPLGVNPLSQRSPDLGNMGKNLATLGKSGICGIYVRLFTIAGRFNR